ncbi:MAG: gamma-glutamylcyclotransferase [Chloroflexi bacterium]|nr:gamma-glutamylcyclotransferase [Chloroflexota bacterium]
MSEYLFVYSTLMEPNIQKAVLGRFIPGAPDALPGYRRAPILRGTFTYFIVVPQADSVVEGLVLEVSADELEKCDRYEGDSCRRFRVQLQSGLEAWVYGT